MNTDILNIIESLDKSNIWERNLELIDNNSLEEEVISYKCIHSEDVIVEYVNFDNNIVSVDDVGKICFVFVNHECYVYCWRQTGRKMGVYEKFLLTGLINISL